MARRVGRSFAYSRRSGARASGRRAVIAASSPASALPTSSSKVQAMAHKKGQGSSRNGRDSNSQRLGVKRHDGNVVTGGAVFVCPKGRRVGPGGNVGPGKETPPFFQGDGEGPF